VNFLLLILFLGCAVIGNSLLIAMTCYYFWLVLALNGKLGDRIYWHYWTKAGAVLASVANRLEALYPWAWLLVGSIFQCIALVLGVTCQQLGYFS